MIKRSVVTLAFLALVMLMASAELTAQRLSYTSGENVSPGYEGWEEDPDGSRWFVFGYMNRNWEEEPVVAIGTDNNIQPGGPDLGTPQYGASGAAHAFARRGIPHCVHGGRCDSAGGRR